MSLKLEFHPSISCIAVLVVKVSMRRYPAVCWDCIPICQEYFLKIKEALSIAPALSRFSSYATFKTDVSAHGLLIEQFENCGEFASHLCVSLTSQENKLSVTEKSVLRHFKCSDTFEWLQNIILGFHNSSDP